MSGRPFKPYPAYKDSGVEWLGEIPAHWEVEQNRWLFRESDVRSQVGEEELLTVSHLTGVTRRSEKPDVTMIEAESHEGYKVCSSGELAINTMWAWMGALGIAREHGMVSPSYNVYRIARDSLVPRYYDYLCRIPTHVSEIIRHSKGIWQSRLRLYPDAFREILTPLPPAIEQPAIAAFLDRETARIDALVARKERLIELLQEKHAAFITRAVTKGLDPNVPMKDSGAEWLGEIPAHWAVGGLVRWWQVVDCKHRTVPFLDEGIALASIGEVQSLEVDLSAAKRTTVEEYRQMISGGREPRRGDVVYSRNATVGAAALVTTEEPFCMGQDVSLIRAADQDQRFLVFLLRSPAIMGQLDSSMVGSSGLSQFLDHYVLGS